MLLFLSQCFVIVAFGSSSSVSGTSKQCKIVYKLDDSSAVSAVAVDNVHGPERCCSECRGLPTCNAWTWGVWAGDSHPTNCDNKAHFAYPTERITALVPSDVFELKTGMDCFADQSGSSSSADPQMCKMQCIQQHRNCSAVVYWNGACSFRSHADCGKHLVPSPGRTMYLRVRKEPVLAVQTTSTEVSTSTSATTTSLTSTTGTTTTTAKCSNIEHDIDYQLAGHTLDVFEQVDHPEGCCDRCHANAKCRAWTWGLAPLSPTGPLCRVMSTEPQDSAKHASPGLVSGYRGDRAQHSETSSSHIAPEEKEATAPRAEPFKQCGGASWMGPAKCVEGYTCHSSNRYYAQCEPDKSSLSAGAGSSIFCWSLLTPGTYEPLVLTKQWELSTGIFDCDAHSIVSNVSSSVLFPTGPLASMVHVSQIHVWLWSSMAYGPHGNAHVLNTPVFIKAWHQIIRDGVYKKHDWTLKLDVDALIVVPRVRSIIANHDARQEIVLWNTAHDAVGNFLHGPVEALSKAAVDAYDRGAQYCIDHVNYETEGEDYYMGICMRDLKVQGVYEPLLLHDAYMMGKRYVNCYTQHAVFHPLKSPEELVACANVVDQGTSISIRRFSSTRVSLPSVVQFGAKNLVALVMVALGSGALIAVWVQRRLPNQAQPSTNPFLSSGYTAVP